MITTTGVFDLDEATYHGDPCPEPSLSSSVAKLLINRSARHAQDAHPRLNPDHRPEHNQKFDLGSAFHTLFLRKGAEIVEIDANDYRSNAAKEARDQARAAGKIPMLKSQLTRAVAMVKAVQDQVLDHDELRIAFAAGQPERTIIWREANGIWCRALLDWMPEQGDAYPDLKSTETAAHPDSWGRGVMFNNDYDIQDAWYRRGLRALGLSEDPYVVFVAAELDEPLHLMATHRCSPSAAALADRMVENAVDLFGWCLKNKRWPGYAKQTAWHDAPVWREERMLNREFAIQQLIKGAA